MKFSSLFVIVVAGIQMLGCSSAPPPKSTAQAASEKPWQDMKAKMDAMTPAERTEYIKNHPDEMARLGETKL